MAGMSEKGQNVSNKHYNSCVYKRKLTSLTQNTVHAPLSNRHFPLTLQLALRGLEKMEGRWRNVVKNCGGKWAACGGPGGFGR